MFLEQQIRILEWFLGGHVTLKTVMILKIQLCITLHVKIENQINADFFKQNSHWTDFPPWNITPQKQFLSI